MDNNTLTTLLKLWSNQAKANAKENIFFDVCRLYFYLFCLFFDLFPFHVRLRLVWIAITGPELMRRKCTWEMVFFRSNLDLSLLFKVPVRLADTNWNLKYRLDRIIFECLLWSTYLRISSILESCRIPKATVQRRL